MHDESAEKCKSQSLVTLLGLDGKHLVFCRRGGGICLDIPFYRTGLSVCMVRRRVASEKRTIAVGLRQCIRPNEVIDSGPCWISARFRPHNLDGASRD